MIKEFIAVLSNPHLMVKPFRQLWLLTIKNLRLLLRSRASALIIIFAPLIMILIIGLSYNTSAQFGLNIGIAVDSFTEDVESFVTLLEEEEFTIHRYEASLDDCIADIKSSKVHTCITLPQSFSVEDNSQKEVTFYIDPSRINIVWMIQETVKTKFNIKSQEISQDLAQNVLTQLTDTKNVLLAEESNLNAVKAKTGVASTGATTAKQNLAVIDLTVSTSANESAAVDEDLNTANDLLSDVLGYLGSIEDESQREAARDALNEAKEMLYGDVDENESFNGAIGALQADLNSLGQKLGTAADAIGKSNTDIDTVIATLQEAISDIEAVQLGLSTSYTNLDSQKVTSADTITSPIVTKIERVSPESTYLNYLFPALLVMVVMFSSLLLGTTLVMIEKNSPAFLRNFFLPVKKIIFVMSIYVTNIILILTEIIIILGISLFFLKNSLPVLPAVAFILFVTASVFTFLGMTIGYLFTSEETGVLASISLGSIFLFVSGVILPLEGVSPLIRKITFFNPFVIAEKLVREIFIFNTSFSLLNSDLGLLIAYGILLFITIMIIESFVHEHVVRKMLKHHHRAQVKESKEMQ
ncbi:MAG: ABC transporter permease [Nanoarchaeota archaeon]|nr:ABC transporter permease [Nanoarchaeota archaeon]